MAVLPPIKRFVLDDFQGVTTVQAFASKLFYPLNLFLNAMYSALNNGLTIAANSIGMVTAQASITSSSAGIATTTINWAYPQSPPQGVFVMSCISGGSPILAPLVSWAYNAGVISITMQFVKISGSAVVQAASATYSVTFWVSGG